MNSNNIEKNIKKKNEPSKHAPQSQTPEKANNKERLVPCNPGTVLAIGQNIVAFERKTDTVVRFQMSMMQESRTAMDVTFATKDEADFFAAYLELWNNREHIANVSIMSIRNDNGDRLDVYRLDEQKTHYYRLDDEKKLLELFAAAKAMRDEYIKETQKYDRFWFSIFEDETKGASLWGSINTFDFTFAPGTKFTYVYKAEDVWPGKLLH